MKVRNLLAVILAILVLVSPRTAPAMAQHTGTFDIEVDAPWRMEPRGTSKEFGAIPIQVSIHDADQPATSLDGLLQQLIGMYQKGFSITDVLYTFVSDVVLGPELRFIDGLIKAVIGVELIPTDQLPGVETLDRFLSLTVSEESNGTFVPRATFDLTNIHEVERTVGTWKYAEDQTGPESLHTPPPRPSYALCRHWRGEDCSGFAALRPTSEWNMTAMYTPQNRSAGTDVRLLVELKMSTVRTGDPGTQTVQRMLTVYLGDEPLPKFDSGWAYGDLHYHSQGTDNDGESGYAYRGVLQAMGAMGLDFAFATDHASNSPQITSALPITSFELVQPLSRALRDLSPDRFANNVDLLNGTFGANREVTSYARSLDGQLVAPQLFMGSEVDVTPEDAGDQTHIKACIDLPMAFKVIDQKTYPWFVDDYWCDTMSDPQPDGRALAFDVQGPDDGRFLSTHFYGRQHLLHLPVDGQRRDAFIPSNTSKYGGATRRLGEILNVELAQRQKGFIFLAHPFDRADGAEMDRMGPDLVPYSQEQLADAFKSPYYLGLQIWNENGLRSAKANDLKPFRSPEWQEQHQPFHDLDFQYWDIQNLYGLDTARTSALSWLGPNQPRRIFAAAGSDSHGDFNFRRKGYFFGTDEVTDTAMGNPRNLVNVGAPQGSTIASAGGTGQPLSQTQVIDGLRSGNFTLTDGPAVRVMIDSNGNGVIDAGDVPMGGVYQAPLKAPFNVIVEWKSSREFGRVNSVDLLVGVWAKGMLDGIVYTRSYDGPIANASNTYIEPTTGKAFVKTPNFPYWYDPNPNNVLAITPNYFEGFYGKRTVTIDPSLYPMGYEGCADSTPMISTSTSTISVSTSIGTTAFATTTTGGTTGGGTTSGDGQVVALQTSLDKKLADLENGVVQPPPQCSRRVFANATRPDRMFVRAEVRNQVVPGSNGNCTDYLPLAGQAEPQCVRRRAYTNPVWVNTCRFSSGCVINTDALTNVVTATSISGTSSGTSGTLSKIGSFSTSGTLTTTTTSTGTISTTSTTTRLTTTSLTR